jgi:hypothetical protein
MKILAITIAGLLAVLAGAQAAQFVPPKAWEFARWGMNPEQLRAASRGAVSTGSPGYDRMIREYSMAKFKFDVVFDYVPPHEDPGNNNPKTLRLDAVLLNLNLKSGTCAELTAYLKNIYGKPNQVFASGPAGFLWHEKELGDDIEYSTWNEHKGCTVMYMPLGASNR